MTQKRATQNRIIKTVKVKAAKPELIIKETIEEGSTSLVQSLFDNKQKDHKLLGLAAVHLHAEMPSLDTFFDIRKCF